MSPEPPDPKWMAPPDPTDLHELTLLASHRMLRWEIEKLEKRYANAQLAYREAVEANWRWDYPTIPGPMVRATMTGEGIPDNSGVYFIWRNGGVVYVGQSICLTKRCGINFHDHLRNRDEVSWLLFPRSELNFAEAFYIAIARPLENFGGSRIAREKKLRPRRRGKSFIESIRDEE